MAKTRVRDRSKKVVYAYVGSANRNWLENAISKKKYASFSSFVTHAIERARGR